MVALTANERLPSWTHREEKPRGTKRMTQLQFHQNQTKLQNEITSGIYSRCQHCRCRRGITSSRVQQQHFFLHILNSFSSFLSVSFLFICAVFIFDFSFPFIKTTKFVSAISTSDEKMDSAVALVDPYAADAATKLLSAFSRAEVPFFTDEILKKSATSGSLIIGPPVIHSLLLLLRHGATGQTRIELDNFFGVDDEKNENDSLASRLSRLTPPVDRKTFKKIELDFGLGIFLDAFLEGSKTFDKYKTDVLQAAPSTSVTTVDFKKDAAGAVEKVNEFVDEKTKGRIKTIIQLSDIHPLTVLVLASAMFFKGQWEYQFPPEKTSPGLFYSLKTREKSGGEQGGKEEEGRYEDDEMVTLDGVQFMETEPKLNPGSKRIGFLEDETEQVTVLELPYKQNGLTMVIFMPHEATNFRRFSQKKLKEEPGLLNRLVNDSRKRRGMGKIWIRMPKFRIEGLTATDMKQTMKELGIESMFDFRNEFGGIAENDLSVSKFFSKAVVEVTEKGTVAAAAAAVLLMRAMPAPAQECNIDKPFLFQIRYSPFASDDDDDDDDGGNEDNTESKKNRRQRAAHPPQEAEHDIVLFEGQVVDPLPLQKEFKENFDDDQ